LTINVSHAYPLMLDVTDRLVVIIGGGAVASRKVAGLLAAGATRVRVVSPAFDLKMPASACIERITERYDPRHLDGASLVFAATDVVEVNTAVVAEARRRGILVNRADGIDEGGDFSTPAVLRDGAVTVTVATTGSPAIAAAIRDSLRDSLDARWVALTNAMTTLRPAILVAGLTGDARRELFRALASDEAIAVVSRGGESALRGWIEQRIGKKLG
jgi:precorrin-2 dehydrogenase/sirohydrochlorin ferrochelatase